MTALKLGFVVEEGRTDQVIRRLVGSVLVRSLRTMCDGPNKEIHLRKLLNGHTNLIFTYRRYQDQYWTVRDVQEIPKGEVKVESAEIVDERRHLI